MLSLGGGPALEPPHFFSFLCAARDVFLQKKWQLLRRGSLEGYPTSEGMWVPGCSAGFPACIHGSGNPACRGAILHLWGQWGHDAHYEMMAVRQAPL